MTEIEEHKSFALAGRTSKWYRFSSQLRTHFIIPLCAPVLALDDVMLPSPNYLTPPPMLSGAAAAEDGKRRRLTESEWKLPTVGDVGAAATPATRRDAAIAASSGALSSYSYRSDGIS